MRYPADPPTVDEIVAVLRHTASDRHGYRLRGMIVVLWRAGLRVQGALALTEHDLDQRRGSLLARRAKGGRRREVGMDPWGWEHLRPWPELRMAMPVGPLLCVIDGPPRPALGERLSPRPTPTRRLEGRCAAAFAPHQLRHAHAVELAHEGVPLNVIQRQLGHTTSASPPSICKASTTPGSSPPSTPARRR
jgi:integrase